jgi:hypothetical protein
MSLPSRTTYLAEFCAECDREFNVLKIYEYEQNDHMFCSNKCLQSYTSSLCSCCESRICCADHHDNNEEYDLAYEGAYYSGTAEYEEDEYVEHDGQLFQLIDGQLNAVGN